jgi:hypothetical protein
MQWVAIGISVEGGTKLPGAVGGGFSGNGDEQCEACFTPSCITASYSELRYCTLSSGVQKDHVHVITIQYCCTIYLFFTSLLKNYNKKAG